MPPNSRKKKPPVTRKNKEKTPRQRVSSNTLINLTPSNRRKLKIYPPKGPNNEGHITEKSDEVEEIKGVRLYIFYVI